MHNLVQFELPEVLPPLTAAQKQELREAKKMPFVYDEDCPPQTEEELRQFKRVMPKVAQIKSQLTQKSRRGCLRLFGALFCVVRFSFS